MRNTADSTFSARLKELRFEQNLSQYVLSKDLGLSRSLISNYELGIRQPELHTLIVLANYFKVSVDYLLGVTDIRYTPSANAGTLETVGGEKSDDILVPEKYKNMLSKILSLTPPNLERLEDYIHLLTVYEQNDTLHHSKGTSCNE